MAPGTDDDLFEGGEAALALRQYHACRAVLRRELGIEPSPVTRQLYTEILAVLTSSGQSRWGVAAGGNRVVARRAGTCKEPAPSHRSGGRADATVRQPARSAGLAAE